MADLPTAEAGPDKIPAMREAICWLHENDLERIVMLSREEQLRGKLRPLEVAYLDELEGLNLSYFKTNYEIKFRLFVFKYTEIERIMLSRMSTPSFSLQTDWIGLPHLSCEHRQSRKRLLRMPRQFIISFDGSEGTFAPLATFFLFCRRAYCLLL